MKTDTQVMQQALEALDRVMSHGAAVQEAKDILRERLAQPDMAFDEALRLAEQLDRAPYSSPCTNAAAAELRRLHEENQKLIKALMAQPVQSQRWAVFCAGCRKEWSVPYQHPGKSVCEECEAKLKAQPEQDEQPLFDDWPGGWKA